MSDDVLWLLRTAVETCAALGVRYAVIGAVARNAWAKRRRSPRRSNATWASGVESRAPEFLIVYKLIAGRPRDYDDIEQIVRTRALAGEPVGLERIRSCAREWGVKDRLERMP